MKSINQAIVKYADLVALWGVESVRRDAETIYRKDKDEPHEDGKKTLVKISGKRPGKKCGKSYVSADKNCKEHSTKTESGKRKLTALGKKSAEELAAKVRARKGESRIANDDVDSSPTFKDLRRAESEIRKQSYETLKVFGQDGKELVSLDGSESEVVIPHDKYALFKDAIFTHNHPSGWEFEESSPQSGGKSFSDEDLIAAAGLDVKEVRAISRGFIYSMKRPKEGWPKHEEVAKDLAKIEDEVQSFFWPKINAAKTDEEQKEEIDKAESLHHHMKSEKLAAKIGATYTRKPWSDR